MQITIDLPDVLEQALAQTAAQTNQSTEALILQLLAQTLIGQATPEEATSLDPSDDPPIQI